MSAALPDLNFEATVEFEHMKSFKMICNSSQSKFRKHGHNLFVCMNARPTRSEECLFTNTQRSFNGARSNPFI